VGRAVKLRLRKRGTGRAHGNDAICEFHTGLRRLSLVEILSRHKNRGLVFRLSPDRGPTAGLGKSDRLVWRQNKRKPKMGTAMVGDCRAPDVCAIGNCRKPQACNVNVISIRCSKRVSGAWWLCTSLCGSLSKEKMSCLYPATLLGGVT
jgi:hypothetical protein